MSRARTIDEQEREIRRKQEEERDALKQKQVQEQVGGATERALIGEVDGSSER